MPEPALEFRDFFARLMEAEGAVVEKIEPGGLEFLAPMHLQEALHLDESGRLGFSTDMPENAARVSFESDWLERVGRLVAERGRYLRRVLNLSLPALPDPDLLLQRHLVLQNAVCRATGAEPAWTRYLILAFHYAAVSDEKREGIVYLGVNLSNGSPLDGSIGAFLSVLDSPVAEAGMEFVAGNPPPLWDQRRLKQWLERGLDERVRQPLQPFVKSMQRRLERDLARIHEYHNALYSESQTRATKQPGELEKEEQRQQAILQEYRAKAVDLQEKYALRIEVKWLQTLDLVLPVQRVQAVLKRRKGVRPFHLDWNPLIRRLEPPPCEFSFTAQPGRLLCDEALHLVCPAAHSPCPVCSRPYCRACYPARCPRCPG